VTSDVETDTQTLDDTGSTDENNKIIKSATKFNNTNYIITKRYVNVENGLEFNQIYFYISPTSDEVDATYCILLKLDDPLTILNSSKLPYTDHYSYKLTRLEKSGSDFVPTTEPISNSDDTKFELIVDGNKQYIRWNLTSYSESQIASVGKNEFVYQIDIEIDPTDTSRQFINSNPIERRTYFYFKFGDGTALDSAISYNNTPPMGLPTYTITPVAQSVVEGNNLTFNVSGTNIVNGTYYWTITKTAINTVDFTTFSGSFTITNNSGAFSVIPTADNLTEGTETFTVSSRSGSMSGPILQTSSPITIYDQGTNNSGGGGDMIPSGTNPTYWLYPVPTDKVYPTTATATTSNTLIIAGDTPVVSITFTLDNNLVALEPMEIAVVDKSRHFNAFDLVSMEPGQSSVTWTRPMQKLDNPMDIDVYGSGFVPKYYDPRLGSPRRIKITPAAHTFRVSGKPIIYNQTIACNLIAGKTFEEIPMNAIIPASHINGTATYDVYYHPDGSPYYMYRGGCSI
jgi:hypothetical protein